MKVAIVCDWLTGLGGAERVVMELHKLYPEAPIYTSQYDPLSFPELHNTRVSTFYMQRLPKALKKFLPILRAWSFGHLDLSKYDLVISSSGAEAKSVKTGLNTTHVCYMHAPTHYYWARYDEYIKNPGFGKLDFLARFALKLFVGPMRKWDFKAAQRPNYIITNSSFSQSQIKKYYNRESVVIYPPVDTESFNPRYKNKERQGLLIAGRQTPYKMIDLAVKACTRLNVPLTVIGNGPDHEKLIDIAGPSIKFLTDIEDTEMPDHFQSAKAFIFPGTDDFGIVAVEALAAGTPVIAYKAGGALDYIHDKDNGLFFDQQSPASLEAAINELSKIKFNHQIISSSASVFSYKDFDKNIESYINNLAE